MPRGRRPSIAALTRLGARKASEMVILTCRTLHFSRVQSSAIVVIRPETTSSSHRRPRAIALTRRARRSNCSGRTSLRDALCGSRIWRDLLEGGFCQGIESDRSSGQSDASSVLSDLSRTTSSSLCTTISATSRVRSPQSSKRTALVVDSSSSRHRMAFGLCTSLRPGRFEPNGLPAAGNWADYVVLSVMLGTAVEIRCWSAQPALPASADLRGAVTRQLSEVERPWR